MFYFFSLSLFSLNHLQNYLKNISLSQFSFFYSPPQENIFSLLSQEKSINDARENNLSPSFLDLCKKENVCGPCHGAFFVFLQNIWTEK